MEIHFYVLCCETFNYADYVEKCIADKESTFKFPTNYDFKAVTEHHFQLTFGGETVTISFETRQFPKLPSEQIFGQNVLKIKLSSLAFGIVCINKRVTYITNEVLTSKHVCVFERYTYDLDVTNAVWLHVVYAVLFHLP